MPEPLIVVLRKEVGRCMMHLGQQRSEVLRWRARDLQAHVAALYYEKRLESEAIEEARAQAGG